MSEINLLDSNDLKSIKYQTEVSLNSTIFLVKIKLLLAYISMYEQDLSYNKLVVCFLKINNKVKFSIDFNLSTYVYFLL